MIAFVHDWMIWFENLSVGDALWFSLTFATFLLALFKE